MVGPSVVGMLGPPAGVVAPLGPSTVGAAAPPEGAGDEEGEGVGEAEEGPVTVTASLWLARQWPVMVQMK